MDRYDRDRYSFGGDPYGGRNNWERNDEIHRNNPYDREFHRNRVYQGNMDYENVPNYRAHEHDINYYGSYNRFEPRFREDRNRYVQHHPGYGDIRRGYGISDYEGTSDRYGTLSSEEDRRFGQQEDAYYSMNRDKYRSTGFGGGMGESFPHSHRGIPDYGTQNYAAGSGTGMGSSYGGDNYGGGIGYEGGHRGGTFGNSTYGNSSGNYGGYGAMGGGAFSSGRGGHTSHNSDRSINELGGF